MQRVLVVEDSYLMAEHLCDLLISHEFQPVGPVPPGEGAIALARSEPLDAALLDVKLPHEDWVLPLLDVLQAKGVSFLFVTGSSQDGILKRMDAPVVGKPFEADELIKILRHLMARCV